MLAIIILVLEYVKFIVVGFLFPNYVNMYLPLHLCSFAGIAIIIEAIFGRNKTLDQMWLYVFLPASLLGVLSPSTSLPFLNFFSIHTYLFHGILVLFALIKICCDGIKVRYSGLVESNLILICMVIPIYYLNRLFGTNYFIISDASDFPLAQTIWNAVVPKLGEFGYILGMFVVAFCIFNIIYLILICVRYLKKKK